MLFTGDDDLKRMQADAGRWTPRVNLSAEQARYEHIENEREMRNHRRLREFAFLLFILPPLIGIVSIVAQWIAASLLSKP